MKQAIKCPRCEAKTVERKPRTQLRKTFLFWDKRKRFKCWNCEFEFYSLIRTVANKG